MTDHCHHQNVTPDAIEKAIARRERVTTIPFLRRLYREWYDQFKAEMEKLPSGIIIELGSGGGFFKEVAPSVVSTDSVPFSSNDLTFVPTSVPFNTESISGIFMIDTFCGITDSGAFLTEAQRVLKPGGKIIMIEPANSVWGRVVHRWFCRKRFNRSARWPDDYPNPPGETNNALTWIVFERERDRFHDIFPDLSVKTIHYHTPLRFFLGGGCPSGRTFLSPNAFSYLKRIDSWLSDHSPQWSMFMTVVVEKKQSDS